MTSLLQSGPVDFGVGSRGLEDSLLSGQAACMYKVYEDLRSVCFWEVWQDCSKQFKTHVQRPDEISANLCQLCIDLCFECMHACSRKQLEQRISTKQSWMAIVEVFLLIASCLSRQPHKASGSLQCATYNAIVRSQDDQPSSRWTSGSSWA